MIIETKEISARLKFLIMFSFLIYAGVLVASLVLHWSKSHIFELCLSAIFILWIVFVFAKNYNYISYNSDGPKLILRYSSLQPLSAGNYSIEIQKKDFVKAEIVRKNLGLQKCLKIHVRTPQGVAKYPLVSLSTLSKKELRQLKEDLKITS